MPTAPVQPASGMSLDTLAALRSSLTEPGRFDTGAARRAAAHDASHYALTPEAVVSAASAEEVASLIAACRSAGLPLTLRSGGTSLSGQASGPGVLVDVRTHWREAEVLDEGRRIRVQPGMTLRQANARLARHGRRLGPDPASEGACTVGGVVSNNSSGMNCGTQDNSYRTVESLRFVLPSGTVVDSGAPDADALLRSREPALYEGLVRLRNRVRDNTESRRTIERLFSMKNTMGYALNAFLDHTAPVEILARLMIGSEGTLGFIAEAVFRTVPVRPHTATGLLVLPSVARATDALPALQECGVRTAELLDAAALRVSQQGLRPEPALEGLRVDRHAALLVEFAEDSEEELAELLAAAAPVLDAMPSDRGAALTRSQKERAGLWRLRKGLYTAVAGARPAGTTALLEDIVVPMPSLTATCESLVELFERHGYEDAVIFGHARDANLHFMLTQGFDEDTDVERYTRFTDDMVDLVLGAGGSLKAEHGTGRVMAPYVRRQYGDELFAVMREIKNLCDPAGVLSPGVVLDDDPTAHLRHLKIVPQVDEDIDRCVDCGYCEPVCPSADVTTSPRQRIALLREMALAEAAGDEARRAELASEFEYAAVDSCAADSLCVTACPVSIDTGAVMKRLRADRHGPLARKAGQAVARHWAGAATGVRAGLSVAHALPEPLVRGAAGAVRRLGASGLVPAWPADMPKPGGPRPGARAPEGAEAVFFAACIGSLFAPEGDGEGVPEGAAGAFLALCDRAGVRVAVPEGLDGLCCGTPWQSKGYVDGHRAMAERTLAVLWEATDGGCLPVVCDASSCTHGLTQLLDALPPEERGRYAPLRFTDSVRFAVERLLPNLPEPRKLASLALHPTCSTVHLGIDDDLAAIGRAVAERADVPDSWGCCAFAGDRGLLHPEVTASATAAQAAEVVAGEYEAHASCNRTCEMGMTRATGRPYRHVLELLEEATRPEM
ncbi:FAD-binding and (Fe-S)-binding domain-containing protein [Streptomyces sp. NPDC048590]|uniref:FAD-binding and (Fe-S)-binding domain-containing protein n=1 Tax=Streptomyces sp. NPDC048590 TaxID=3365574 RepID=UPI0037125C36